MRKWMKCKEVAEICGVRVETVWAWIRRGQLKAYRFGVRSYRIDRDDFITFFSAAQKKA